MRPRRALVPFAVALLLAACSTDRAPPPRTCCEQPTIPPGVTPFVVVAEDVSGPSDGEKVVLRAGLSQPASRDQIYPVLHTLYRHAMKRGPFEPIHFVANVYRTEAAARSGGDADLVAVVRREQTDLAPKCDNRVPYDFSEQAARAFAAATGRGKENEEDSNDTCRLAEKKASARVDDGFTRKPAIQVDAARAAVEITHPYLELGQDEYVKDLKFNSAMRDWIEYTTSFFRRVEGLKELAFVGVHGDQPVVRIRVTREDFDGKLASLQEEIASHAAITFANLGMRRKNDKAAEKEQAAFHAKTYRSALASLAKDRVFVSPKLK